MAARSVAVAPQRLEHWLADFANRHGGMTVEPETDGIRCLGADGVVALAASPFPPMPPEWAAGDVAAVFVAHVCARRVIGLVLVRLGGFAAGVFDGEEVLASKVGARQVHGRSAAGGWSQQRFARRREGQVKVAIDAAAQTAASIVLPFLPRLDAVVTGGDRTALRAVVGDPRLASLRPLIVPRILDVGDPKARVLAEAARACRAVAVTVTEAS